NGLVQSAEASGVISPTTTDVPTGNSALTISVMTPSVKPVRTFTGRTNSPSANQTLPLSEFSFLVLSSDRVPTPVAWSGTDLMNSVRNSAATWCGAGCQRNAVLGTRNTEMRRATSKSRVAVIYGSNRPSGLSVPTTTV